MTRFEAKTPEELQASADEFERDYAASAGNVRNREQLDKRVAELRAAGRVVKPCDCGEIFCKGWQSVNGKEWDEDEALRRSETPLAEILALCERKGFYRP